MSESIKVVQLYPVPIMRWCFFAQQGDVDEGVAPGLGEKRHLLPFTLTATALSILPGLPRLNGGGDGMGGGHP